MIRFICTMIAIAHYNKSVGTIEVIEVPEKYEASFFAGLDSYNDHYPLLLFKSDGIYTLDRNGIQVKL